MLYYTVLIILQFKAENIIFAQNPSVDQMQNFELSVRSSLRFPTIIAIYFVVKSLHFIECKNSPTMQPQIKI